MAECPKCDTPMQNGIVMSDDAVAVSIGRFIKKGCPHCESRDLRKKKSYDDVTYSLWECFDCDKLFLVVDNDVEKCPVSFGNDNRTWVPEILR